MANESLDVIAQRIEQALYLVIELLREGIADAADDAQTKGYDPTDDKSHFNHCVRRHLRQNIRPYIPTMSKAAPMSPVHLPLGPYQLKVLHADDGDLPQAQTDARKDYYGLNDRGIVSMNVFPPDELCVLDTDAAEIEEGALVLIWDSTAAELTQATLVRPSKMNGHERMDLLTPVLPESDLDEIARRDGQERRTLTGTDDAASSDGMDAGTDEDDEGQ